jgi:hypothetical protein
MKQEFAYVAHHNRSLLTDQDADRFVMVSERDKVKMLAPFELPPLPVASSSDMEHAWKRPSEEALPLYLTNTEGVSRLEADRSTARHARVEALKKKRMPIGKARKNNRDQSNYKSLEFVVGDEDSEMSVVEPDSVGSVNNRSVGKQGQLVHCVALCLSLAHMPHTQKPKQSGRWQQQLLTMQKLQHLLLLLHQRCLATVPRSRRESRVQCQTLVMQRTNQLLMMLGLHWAAVHLDVSEMIRRA